MDRKFFEAVSTRPTGYRRFTLDRILFFSSEEWIAFAQNRVSLILVQCLAAFIFGLWSVDSLANQKINWNSAQYPIVFTLFSLLFLVRGFKKSHLIPHILIALISFVDIFVISSSILSPDNIFSITSPSLVLYISPVAIANAVVFKPKIGACVNLGLVACLSVLAVEAISTAPNGFTDLHLITRILGVTGFYLWFALALYAAFSLYTRHRLELVEVHHLVAEMERNQRLNEENSRIRDDLVRTQRVQMVDSMTSTMAHEVNQPISCANNYIQAARRWLARPEPALREALLSLDGAQDEIVRVGERVMSVRRLMQRLSSEYTHIGLAELLGRLDSIVHRDLATRNIRLMLDTSDEDDEFYIFGCEEELIQVLMNMIANSIDALADKADGRQIVLSLAEADLGEIKVCVADNGCGIAPENIGRVFDRLFSTKAGGSGLGLALSHRIVTNHGGTIAIESQPDEGTQVIMRFPRAKLRNHWGM